MKDKKDKTHRSITNQIAVIKNHWNKRALRVISRDGNDLFTIVTFKPLSDQVCIGYQCLCLFKQFIFNCGFSAKVICAFLSYKKQWRNSQKSTLFGSEQRRFLSHFWSD